MADIREAMQAKSDQLNAQDIIGYEPVLLITSVTVTRGEQPVSVHYHGDNGRPWKPSKGMLRGLSAGWGPETDNWIGKSVRVYNDETVKWAGKEVGGIRIREMSHIKETGIKYMLRESRQKVTEFFIGCFTPEFKTYPDAAFNKNLPVMIDKMNSGEMTIQQVIAHCQKTGGNLTDEQLKQLHMHAPTDEN